MVRIATRVANQPTLALVLTDSKYYAVDGEDGGPITLFVIANLRTPNQKLMKEHYFASIILAEQYAQQEHSVSVTDWLDDAPFHYDFHFDYTVSYTGVPQPSLLDSPGAKLVFRLETEDTPDGKDGQALHICGNKDGLRRLAARLLLCADSEQYDESFHIHLDHHDEELTTNISVTLRSPSYLESLTAMSSPSRKRDKS